MTDDRLRSDNEVVRQAWEANAAYWDNYMGVAGNDFVNLLVWPRVARLLQLKPGEQVLDIACGNGLYALRLAEMGAQVVAFDFSSGMVELARARVIEAGLADRVDCHVVDATDRAALASLGERSFAAAICNMALFDMADIEPLAEGLAHLLRPGGIFLFSVTHPCFNGVHTTFMTETADDGVKLATRFSLKQSRYLTPYAARGIAIKGQPEPHLYFHRSLQDILAPFLGNGFVLDALEEAAFPPENRPDKLTSWSGNYSEFPPVLVGRFRR